MTANEFAIIILKPKKYTKSTISIRNCTSWGGGLQFMYPILRRVYLQILQTILRTKETSEIAPNF